MKKAIISAVCAGACFYPLFGQTSKQMTQKEVHQYLDDVMEIIDTTFLKSQLERVEEAWSKEKNLINEIRLGIIYHEVALNFGFFDNHYKGYPEKSLDRLNKALLKLPPEWANMKPFLQSYQASALALLAGETRKLSYLRQAFALFKQAVEEYGSVCYSPEFMRGSVAENLPWFMFGKRKYAKRDFSSLILKYEQDDTYAPAKIMSFTYWAWANAHSSKKHRRRALDYLEKSIELDPHYEAGRKRAEELKAKWKAKSQ